MHATHQSRLPITPTLAARIREYLAALYGAERAANVYADLQAILADFHARHPDLAASAGQARFDETDVVLITYGDQVQEPGQAHLRTLAGFLETHVRGVVTGVHLLPFYPASSDDGFSVIDYLAVDPSLGDWDDVARLAKHFRLMFDAVINHVSQQSAWFQAFKAGDPRYRDFFVDVDPATDLSMVVRPRTLPLLTPVETTFGRRYVWTTFSADQIDLNYANPAVLLEIVRVLLHYVAHGAEIIRLDAIAYLWKQPGTASIHLPQTHYLIKLIRAVMDAVAPRTVLITETNVPHDENVSYFGNGADEAQLVYNFSLPPLVLHTFLTGDATRLQQWAATLRTPSAQTAFFNFLASHDGIGIRPASGILRDEEISWLADRAQAHGGFVSLRSTEGGGQSPYELNISYFDALSDPSSGEPLELQVARFAAAHAIMLALAGVPALYVHSLFGSRNWTEGVRTSGIYRRINRAKWQKAEIERELNVLTHRRSLTFARLRRLIQLRTARRAFHPAGAQTIVMGNPAVFTLVRVAPDDSEQLLALHNVTAGRQIATLPPGWQHVTLTDLMSGETFLTPHLALAPYQVRWLVPLQPPPDKPKS